MMLRELTEDEIKSLSRRNGVKGRAVEEFLARVGGISMDAAYERLNRARKLKGWNLQTASAISDGIVLATTKREGKQMAEQGEKNYYEPLP
jgi:hypothetical protein